MAGICISKGGERHLVPTSHCSAYSYIEMRRGSKIQTFLARHLKGVSIVSIKPKLLPNRWEVVVEKRQNRSVPKQKSAIADIHFRQLPDTVVISALLSADKTRAPDLQVSAPVEELPVPSLWTQRKCFDRN